MMADHECPPHDFRFATTHYCSSYSCIVAVVKCSKCGLERGPSWIESHLAACEALSATAAELASIGQGKLTRVPLLEYARILGGQDE